MARQRSRAARVSRMLQSTSKQTASEQLGAQQRQSAHVHDVLHIKTAGDDTEDGGSNHSKPACIRLGAACAVRRQLLALQLHSYTRSSTARLQPAG